MADKGIIFSAPMVLALLDGRKTQTRRLIKMYGRRPEYCGPSGCKDDPTCWGWEDGDHGGWVTLEKEPGDRMGWRDWVGAPHVSDRLYVREAYMPRPGLPARLARPHYRADNDRPEWRRLWKPSIHMPRWASRLWLEVTEVRVQRVQDISEEDARAEGLVEYSLEGPGGMTIPCWHWLSGMDDDELYTSAVSAFRALWNSLHTKPGETWADNPWVVAVSFDVHQGNIDAEQAA
ncbi:MAG: hypothetical protein VYD90_10855 [Pseudomonadota bacterium]|nr:hypothetical protein [Pseudomonadota bacterium]